MKNMNDLIEKATKDLESMSNLSDMVGNRPHFPMFVLQNNMSENGYDKLYRKMSKIWPQTVTKVVFSSYKVNGDEFQLASLENGQEIGIDAMKSELDKVKMFRDTFAEMRLWFIYNVIDTSVIASIDEFQSQYLSVKNMREIVIDNSRTMLIVLLDDSSLKREMAKEIKEFLSKTTGDYDGVFIISNRTYNSEMYKMEDLYGIAANVIVLSNNDAISSYDDQDYATRLSCFYNNHVNTVSYSLFERPNRKIIIQMIDTFLQSMQRRINQKVESFDINERGRKLGITDKVEQCEEFLKRVNYRFNINDMEYLPMRNGENIQNLKIGDMNYSQFKSLTFDGVVEQFVESYYNTVLMPEVNVAHFSTEYEDDIKNKVSATEGVEITDDLINNLFMRFSTQEVNKTLSIDTYIKEQMYLSIRKNVLYPICREILAKVRKDSELTITECKKVCNDFISSIPVDGFDEIGTMYQTIVESYLQSEKGRNDIDNILRSGNKYEDMLEIILAAVLNVIKNNKSKFSLPFIEEWEERLNLAGDVIYREIYDKLDANSKNNIHLFGNFTIEEKMQIYMLHTSDAKGINKTDLFAHLEQAYNGVTGAQFFNTGIDDSLEVLKIVDCSGDKLLW